MPRPSIDLAGQRFGRLVAIQSIGYHNHKALWKCECDCGNFHTAAATHLQNRHTRSCGCLKNRRGRPKHGFSKSGERHPLYHTWTSMRRRCNNPNDPAYKYYGGRGIKVYERWDADFAVFLNYILTNIGLRPPGMVLDRIDNNRGYEPGNVRFRERQTTKAMRDPGAPAQSDLCLVPVYTSVAAVNLRPRIRRSRQTCH